MPVRQIEVPDALNRFIEEEVASGVYADASEVVREALLRLEMQKQDQAEMEGLRAAIAEGDASGVFEGDDPFEYARAAAGLPPAKR